jgi:type IV pilus assembly protein PilW
VNALAAGDATAAQRLRRIKAVRVGLILRSRLAEKQVVAPGSLTLFGDLGTSLAYTRSFDADEQHYRYRAIEATVPVRNNLLVD